MCGRLTCCQPAACLQCWVYVASFQIPWKLHLCPQLVLCNLVYHTSPSPIHVQCQPNCCQGGKKLSCHSPYTFVMAHGLSTAASASTLVAVQAPVIQLSCLSMQCVTHMLFYSFVASACDPGMAMAQSLPLYNLLHMQVSLTCACVNTAGDATMCSSWSHHLTS